MKIWAIADLHLSFGIPNKEMDVFGGPWINHAEKIKANWLTLIQPEDLVLIPGDISWAMTPEQAHIDLQWIHELPGTKVMIKGNHDYWWTSLKKISPYLPSSIHLIQNSCFVWNGIGIGGTRLWDNVDLNFDGLIEIKETSVTKPTIIPCPEETRKVYQRELARLESSLKMIPASCSKRIALTHYPPIGPFLQHSPASDLLEKYKINACAFGHIHSLKHSMPLFGALHGIQYIFTACDYLNCTPIQIHI